MRDRLLPFRVACSVAAVMMVSFLWAPAGTRTILLGVGGVVMPLAIVVGMLVHRPATREVWGSLALCGVIWTVSVMPIPFLHDMVMSRVHVRDVAVVSGYVVLIGGVLSAGRRVTRDRPTQFLVDAAIFAIGCLSVIWSFAVGAGAPLGNTLAAMTSPFLDVLAIIASARLVLLAGGQVSPVALLSSLSLVTIGDVVSLQDRAGRVGGLTVGSGWYLAGFLTASVAALHPSMVRFGARHRAVPRHLERLHLLAIALAAVMPPLMLLREPDGPTLVTAAPLVLMSAAVFTLVMVRLERMMSVVDAQRLQLQSLARTDHLTSLPNRRTGDAELSRMRQDAEDQGVPLVVALLDLDHFKAYNDEHGHPAGDRLLEATASAWRRSLPHDVFVSRYGGEEFLLLARGRHPDNVRLLLEGLRGARQGTQTFSAGVAVWDGLESERALVDRADRALYEAKDAGRDRVVFARRRAVVLAGLGA